MDPNKMYTLYVGNLDYVVEESDIYDLFREFDVLAIHMKFTFCFVTFANRIQARDAMTLLDGTELFEKRIRIQWARSNYSPGGSFNTQPTGYQNLSNSASSLASSASNQSSVSLSQPTSVVSIQNSSSSSLQPVTENTLLECEICFVRFDYSAHRPRSLPCGHSLCSLCITDTFKANEDSGNDCILCPFCRTSCGPYKKRVGQFPETFFILKMLEVESEKAKGNEDTKEKEREAEEKKQKEEKKKEQEEEYLKFQKQIGLDSTMSGIISCKDHMESLEDLHKEQLSVKKQLKTKRKRLLSEVSRIESELMELSEQMFNIEVWIASGKNLLTKFDKIQENFTKEEDKEIIECSYEAAERCCLATQRWSDGSTPDIDKMNLFVKKKKKHENEEVVEVSEALDEQNRTSETSTEGASYVLSASGIDQSIRPTQRKFVKKSKFGMTMGVKTNDSVSEDDTDIGSDLETFSDELVPTKRNTSIGVNCVTEKSSDRPKLIIRKSSNRDNGTSESTTGTSVPFNVTSTPHSFNFGSTSNPFQTNALSTTTAALFSCTTTTSSLSLSSSVTTVLGLGNSNTKTNTSANKNLFSNASSALGPPLFSSCKTSTVSSSYSMGNLSHPSTSGSLSTSTSVPRAANQTPSEDTSNRNSFTSTSVRPKVNSEFDQTETLLFQSLPNITNNLSKSESSLQSTNVARKTTFDERADLHKKLNVAFKNLFPEFRLDGSNNVNATDFTTNTATMTTTTTSISASTSVCKSTTLPSPCSPYPSLASIFTRDLGDKKFSSVSPVCTTIVDNALETTAETSKLNSVLTAFSGFKFSSAVSTCNKNPFTFSNASMSSAQTSNSVFNTSSGFSFPSAVPTHNKNSNENSFTLSNASISSAQTSNSVFNTSSRFCFPSVVSAHNKNSNGNSFTFSNTTTQANEIFTMKSSPTSASVRPKIPKSLSQINLVDDTDSIFATSGNIAGKSNCDSGSMKSPPSFSFTMSPGKFSAISFTPSASTETTNCNNVGNSTGLPFPKSTISPKVSSFNLGSFGKPISLNPKPKNLIFSNHKHGKDSNFDNSDYDSS